MSCLVLDADFSGGVGVGWFCWNDSVFFIL